MEDCAALFREQAAQEKKTLVVKAAPTAHHGPSTIPATTLIVCWKGKHFVGPIGMETTESATPAAASTPASTAFLKIRLCLSFVISYLSSLSEIFVYLVYQRARRLFGVVRAHYRAGERYAARAASGELANVG